MWSQWFSLQLTCRPAPTYCGEVSMGSGVQNLFLNGSRLFHDRAGTMEGSIWTPSVVAIKFNVENCVLLKQRETNEFHIINCSVYFYHLKIINRSFSVLARITSNKIHDKYIQMVFINTTGFALQLVFLDQQHHLAIPLSKIGYVPQNG